MNRHNEKRIVPLEDLLESGYGEMLYMIGNHTVIETKNGIYRFRQYSDRAGIFEHMDFDRMDLNQVWINCYKLPLDERKKYYHALKQLYRDIGFSLCGFEDAFNGKCFTCGEDLDYEDDGFIPMPCENGCKNN